MLVELNEIATEKIIRLEKDMEEIITPDIGFSSVAANSFKSTHTYYSENAEKWSLTYTVPGIPASENTSRIFLFFRNPEQISPQLHAKQKSLGRKFQLLDGNHNILYNLSDKNIREDKDYGWLSFHAPLPPGQYFLSYTDKKLPREIPIYLFSNWQTQVFMLFTDTPVFGSLRIMIEKSERGFDPDDTHNYLLDTLLQKLYNGLYYLPDSVLEKLASEKWENPMAGILGAYMYLNGERNDRNDLFTTILENLGTRILNDLACPDLIALNMLGAKHLNKPYQGPSLLQPPMLLAGMKAAIAAGADNTALIPSGSMAEYVVINLFSDIPWTSYEPFPLPEFTTLRDLDFESSMLANLRGAHYKITHLNFDDLLLNSIELFAAKNPTEWKLPLQKSNKKMPGAWISNAIIQYLSADKDSPLDIKKMAVQLQLTPAIIERTLESIGKVLPASYIHNGNAPLLSKRKLDISNLLGQDVGNKNLNLLLKKILDIFAQNQSIINQKEKGES